MLLGERNGSCLEFVRLMLCYIVYKITHSGFGVGPLGFWFQFAQDSVHLLQLSIISKTDWVFQHLPVQSEISAIES